MKNSNSLLANLILALILLSACTLPTNTQSELAEPVRVWFDAPLPETVLAPPNPCQFVAHGASPSGITSFELLVNGSASTIPSPETQSSLVTLTRDCGITEPGKYLLRLRALDNDGSWSQYAETSLTILESETSTPLPPTDDLIPASTTPTLTPTLTPTSLPAGGVSIESISTNLVYLGRSSCGIQEVTITARAAAPNGIKVVVLFYRFQTGNSSGEFESLSMNLVSGDLYQRTINPTSLLGGVVPFEQATLQYQVVVQQNDGDTSIRTPVLADIVVQACGGVTISCSSYTDERTCTANGCDWVSIPGAVPIYECRNP